MNIEERKKIREKYQSENLLSIISKEMFPQKRLIKKAKNSRFELLF